MSAGFLLSTVQVHTCPVLRDNVVQKARRSILADIFVDVGVHAVYSTGFIRFSSVASHISMHDGFGKGGGC